MKIICACDSFKDCLSAKEVCTAFCKGWQDIYPNSECIQVPLSDGGEGLLDILPLSKRLPIATFDPLMRPIEAFIGRSQSNYFIEMASSCGLDLLNKKERNPMHTSSYGLGVMLEKMYQLSKQKIMHSPVYIGLGGTATNDAGIGCLQALGVAFYNQDKQLMEIPITGKDLIKIASYTLPDNWEELRKTPITLICDVSNPFYGEDGAAYTFAQQKGANSDEIDLLDQGLRHITQLLEENNPTLDIQAIKGGGAAGGIAAILHLFLGAKMTTGIDVILNLLEFEKHLKNTQVIITGEGKIDEQTLSGKVAYGVLKRGQAHEIPVIAIGGQVKHKTQLLKAGFHSIYCINDTHTPLSTQLKASYALQRIRVTAQNCAIKHLHR